MFDCEGVKRNLARHQADAIATVTNAVPSHQVLVDAVEDGRADVACGLLREHVLENEPRYRAACDSL